MTKAAYVLDTHALIWHLQASDSLSPTARSILDTIDAGEATGIVPSITLVEMVYLVEKKRIDQGALDAALSCLESFWANTYPQVRKELQGRYPKHAWPEDPWTATAQRRPRRRS